MIFICSTTSHDSYRQLAPDRFASPAVFADKNGVCETLRFCCYTDMGMGQNPIPLVNIKIAGKWMFIPLKMVCIGIDP
jgi:hypothetical protein